MKHPLDGLLEPGAAPYDVQCSIGISLKRIADALAPPPVPKSDQDELLELTRRVLTPAPERLDLDALLSKAKEVYEAMSPEQKAKMAVDQAAGYAKSCITVGRKDGRR